MKTEQNRKDACREGQSIVEYMILLAVVISLLLVFFSPTDGGFFRSIFTNVVQQQGHDMLNAARTIF